MVFLIEKIYGFSLGRWGNICRTSQLCLTLHDVPRDAHKEWNIQRRPFCQKMQNYSKKPIFIQCMNKYSASGISQPVLPRGSMLGINKSDIFNMFWTIFFHQIYNLELWELISQYIWKPICWENMIHAISNGQMVWVNVRQFPMILDKHYNRFPILKISFTFVSCLSSLLQIMFFSRWWWQWLDCSTGLFLESDFICWKTSEWMWCNVASVGAYLIFFGLGWWRKLDHPKWV